MSFQTNLARAELKHHEREWKSHRMYCPRCSGIARQRRWDLLCEKGANIRAERAIAQDEYDRNLTLDRAPDPDQMRLFDLPGE